MANGLIRRFPLIQPETDQHSGAANWSEAVEITLPGGYSTLYISGVVPSIVNADTPLDTRERYGTMEDQTRTVFQSLRDLLSRHGYEFSNLVKLTCFMVSEDDQKLDLDGFGVAYREFFDDSHLPARSRVVVTRLMDPGWLVEIEAIAVRHSA